MSLPACYRCGEQPCRCRDGITLYHGDCLELLPEVAPRWVDCVWTDPPYNLGVDYGVYKDNLSENQFRDWSDRWIFSAALRLRAGGTFWLLCSDDMADWIAMLMDHHVGPRRRRVIWRETFSQYQEHNFPCQTRHLFYYVCEGGRFIWNPDEIRIPSARQEKYGDKRAVEAGRVPGNVWEFPRVCGTFKARQQGHPCQVPTAMVERCLRATTNARDMVLDPFAGSGTTLQVARWLGRRAIGIELSEDYCKLALTRINQPREAQRSVKPAEGQMEMFG